MAAYPNIWKYDMVALDTETTGLLYHVDKVFAFSITTPDKSYYYDLRRTPKAAAWLQDALSQCHSTNTTVACHYAAFDACMLWAAGVTFPLEVLDCTIVREALIDETRHSFKLDDIAFDRLGKHKLDIDIGRIADLPYSKAKPYAIRDTELTYGVWWDQEDEIGPVREIVDFERSLLPHIIRAQIRGVRVDLDRAAQAMDELGPIIRKQARLASKALGKEFNPKSSVQVKEHFGPYRLVHEDARRPINNMWVREVDNFKVGTTKTGNPSLTGDVLKAMDDPIAKVIVDLKSNLNTRDVFLERHIIGHAVGDRVYPSINQSKNDRGNGVGPGRLSYTDPALQQIPARNKVKGSIVKPCFLPDEGHVWVDGDLASFEVRMFAHLVAKYDPSIVRAYNKNPKLDFHQYVADLASIPRNATYSGQANGKQLNLSMIFNQGRGATAEKMGMKWEWDSFTNDKGKKVTYKRPGVEADRIIDLYHQRLPGVARLAAACKREAERDGYIFTDFGRRIHINRGYKASGIKIQGTSADVNKQNWLKINSVLRDGAYMILNTHDSYGMSMPEDSWREQWRDVKEIVQDQPNLRVPIILDFNGVGSNWWDALVSEESEGVDS